MTRQENLRWAADLSASESATHTHTHWQEQATQLQRQLDFSTAICQMLLQDQQVQSTRFVFSWKDFVVWYPPPLRFFFSFRVCACVYVCLQTLSCMLQSMLAPPYNMLPNNLGSPQVPLIMHQLNQCYTQLAWQQNNVNRYSRTHTHKP